LSSLDTRIKYPFAREWTGLNVGECLGGTFPDTRPEYPDRAITKWQILVSTPVAIEEAISSGLCNVGWKDWSTIIFDEVHHCIKKHPYRRIAFKIRNFGFLPNPQERPRVIGFSATYTYNIDIEKIKSSLEALCDELLISKILISDNEELNKDGYFALGTKAQVIPEEDSFDLTNEVEFEKASKFYDYSENIKKQNEKDKHGRSHELLTIFLERIRDGNASLVGTELMHAIRLMEAEILSPMGIESPVDTREVAMPDWGKWAKTLNVVNASKNAVLEHFYEALRILVVSMEMGFDLAITYLRMAFRMTDGGKPGFGAPRAELFSEEVQVAVHGFWTLANAIPFPRFYCLERLLLDQSERKKENLCGILYVEKRISCHILDYWIRNHPKLKDLITPVPLYSMNSSAAASFTLSKTDIARNLNQFRLKQANLLVSTNVSEEGMDIPQANLVIRFEPMHHSVSLVQSRGRGRQRESDFIVMEERKDRPVARLEEAEQLQNEFARTFTFETFTPPDQLPVPDFPELSPDSRITQSPNASPLRSSGSSVSSASFITSPSSSPNRSLMSSSSNAVSISPSSMMSSLSSVPISSSVKSALYPNLFPPSSPNRSAGSSPTHFDKNNPPVIKGANRKLLSTCADPKAILHDYSFRNAISPPVAYVSTELSKNPSLFHVICKLKTDRANADVVDTEAQSSVKKDAELRAAWCMVKLLITLDLLAIPKATYDDLERKFG